LIGKPHFGIKSYYRSFSSSISSKFRTMERDKWDPRSVEMISAVALATLDKPMLPTHRPIEG
jgi:hypothetical protein